MAERIGLGIIGVGRWADAHAQAAARSDRIRIVGCFGRTAAKRESFASRHGIPLVARTLNDLLVDDRVEAVIVSSPNDMHADHVAQVVQAGKPTLVDKPVTVDISEGISLLRLVKSTGVPVGVAHHARRLAGHRAAKAWIESGQAGEVRIVHADFSNARGAHLAADAWYRTARGSEAGALIQVGIHHLENVQYLIGPVTSVNARFTYKDLGAAMPDAAVVVMTHANGGLSTVSTSWTTPSHYRLDLLATGGNLEFRLDHSQWTSGNIDDFGELLLEAPDETRRPFPIIKGDPLREQLDELALAARQGASMEVGVIEGLRAVAVVEGAVSSAREDGAVVELTTLLATAGATADEIGQLTSVG